jgi:hypothetical protein
MSNLSAQNLNLDIRSFIKGMPGTYVYENLSSGSPWLLNYWCPAVLTDKMGQSYWGAAFKVDLVADKLIYTDKGKDLEVLIPIQTMTLIDSLTRDSIKLARPEYFKIADANLSGWLQVYETGKAVLMHDLNKSLEETKAYGSSAKEYNVNDNFIWIIVLDGTVYRIKKLKEAETILGKNNPKLQGISYTTKGLGPQLQELVRAFNSQP